MASIFLIGPMGSGKSTVGRALARRLGLPFADSDREIEARCGVDIATIFEYEGEAGFRRREARVIDELSASDTLVLATGGGAILAESTRRALRARGHVVLLAVDPAEQLRRVGGDARRPLLAAADPAARLARLMAERGPLYRETAHVEIRTDSRRMHHVVGRICRHLEAERVLAPGRAGQTSASAAGSSATRAAGAPAARVDPPSPSAPEGPLAAPAAAASPARS